MKQITSKLVEFHFDTSSEIQNADLSTEDESPIRIQTEIQLSKTEELLQLINLARHPFFCQISSGGLDHDDESEYLRELVMLLIGARFSFKMAIEHLYAGLALAERVVLNHLMTSNEMPPRETWNW